MNFSLEVLQAKQGDCLILHYNEGNSPKLILIDGGPSGIYNQYLKPRLLSIRQKLVQNGTLPIELVMVSHADDDHINGILAMTNDLVGQMEDNRSLVYQVNNFWFNSFNDIIGDKEISAAAISGAINQSPNHHINACISSTGQGRQLRDNIKKLRWNVNEPFIPMPVTNTKLVRSDADGSVVHIDKLKIMVIHPNTLRLKELQDQWDKDLKKAKRKGDNSILIASLNSPDKSPFNLSSIVCLVEYKSKKILLTGDGRCDDIYEGLKNSKLLDAQGKFHVDILKMPHHGSDANMKPEFLKNITADYYVISADGKHNNPDNSTLDMITNHVKKGKLYLTNRDGENQLRAKLDSFQQQLTDTGSQLEIVFREPHEPSVIINLLDQIIY